MKPAFAVEDVHRAGDCDDSKKEVQGQAVLENGGGE